MPLRESQCLSCKKFVEFIEPLQDRPTICEHCGGPMKYVEFSRTQVKMADSVQIATEKSMSGGDGATWIENDCNGL